MNSDSTISISTLDADDLAQASYAERERCTWLAHSWTVPARLQARFPGANGPQLRMMLAVAATIADDLACGRSSSARDATL